MGHDAYQKSSVDNNDTNKDRQWTTDYPINSHGDFQL